MSRRNLDLWPVDLKLLQHFGCHAFKLGTQFERYWLIRGWVIDDLARFSVQFFGVGHNWQNLLRGACTQLTKLGPDIGRSSQHCIFVSEFGYRAAFSNAGGSNLSNVLNDAKFRTFWPPPLWKLGEEWVKPLHQLLKLYLRPNFGNTFDGHPLRGCWARWIDKKERKFMGET